MVDVFLCVIAIAVLTIVSVNRYKKPPVKPQRIDIAISSQCEGLFGMGIINRLIQEFEEKHPDLRIQVADREIPESDDNADIIFFDDAEFINLMESSALLSLSPYIDGVDEQSVSSWALPLMSFMDLFFYNINILKAANSDRPPKTRAEFLVAARAVLRNNPASPGKEPVFPFALGLSETDPLALRRDIYPWIWMDGGELSAIDTAGTALPRVVNSTMDFFGQLNRERLLAPGTFEKSGQERLEEFAEGKIAMMTASARDIAFLRSIAEDLDFGITTIPATAQGKNRLGLSGLYAGIHSACAHPDEAWKFLSFIAGKSQILARALSAVPGQTDPELWMNNPAGAGYIVQDPLYSKAWEIFEAADIVDYNPGQLLDGEINRIIRERLLEIF